MGKNFLSENWGNLEWSEWRDLKNVFDKTLKNAPGFYRVKPINHDFLMYIGQTKRLRIRIGELKGGVFQKEIPFSDPHVGAPCFWVWKDSENFEFEYSFVALDFEERERKTIEHFLFWNYRLEYGQSPLCSFGKFHPEYFNSSNRQRGIRGRKITDENLNPAGENSYPPLQLSGYYVDTNWMKIKWEESKILNAEEQNTLKEKPAVYKIFTNNELLYIGETRNVKNRFKDHLKKKWGDSEILFSVSYQNSDILPHQLKELENDLIAGYFSQSGYAPKFQFENLT